MSISRCENNVYIRKNKKRDPQKKNPYVFRKPPKKQSSPVFYHKALEYDLDSTDQLRDSPHRYDSRPFPTYLDKAIPFRHYIYPTQKGFTNNALAIHTSDYYTGYSFTAAIPHVNMGPSTEPYDPPVKSLRSKEDLCTWRYITDFLSEFSVLSPSYGWDQLVTHWGVSWLSAANRFRDRWWYPNTGKAKKLVFHDIEDPSDIGRYMFISHATKRKISFLWLDIDTPGVGRQSANPFTIDPTIADKLAYLSSVGLPIAVMTINIVNSKHQLAVPIDPIIINDERPMWFYQQLRKVLLAFLGADHAVGHRGLVRNPFMLGIDPRIVSWNSSSNVPNVKHPHVTYIRDTWVSHPATITCKTIYSILMNDSNIAHSPGVIALQKSSSEPVKTASVLQNYPLRPAGEMLRQKRVYLRLDPGNQPQDHRAAQRKISAHRAAVRCAFILYSRNIIHEKSIPESAIYCVMKTYECVYSLAHKRNNSLGLRKPWMLPTQVTIRAIALSCCMYVIRYKAKRANHSKQFSFMMSVVINDTNQYHKHHIASIIDDSPQRRGGKQASLLLLDPTTKRYKDQVPILQKEAAKRHDKAVARAHVVRSDHAKGASIKELAHKHGVSIRTIFNYLKTE